MDLRKCCCPGYHTPTLCSSALVVAPAEGWGTYQRASADHCYTGACRSSLPQSIGRAGHRKVEIPVPPPTSFHLSRSPAHSDLNLSKGRKGRGRRNGWRCGVSCLKHVQTNNLTSVNFQNCNGARERNSMENDAAVQSRMKSLVGNMGLIVRVTIIIIMKMND